MAFRKADAQCAKHSPISLLNKQIRMTHHTIQSYYALTLYKARVNKPAPSQDNHAGGVMEEVIQNTDDVNRLKQNYFFVV